MEAILYTGISQTLIPGILINLYHIKIIPYTYGPLLMLYARSLSRIGKINYLVHEIRYFNPDHGGNP